MDWNILKLFLLSLLLLHGNAQSIFEDSPTCDVELEFDCLSILETQEYNYTAGEHGDGGGGVGGQGVGSEGIGGQIVGGGGGRGGGRERRGVGGREGGTTGGLTLGETPGRQNQKDQCISIDWVCDTEVDCPNGADERNCTDSVNQSLQQNTYSNIKINSTMARDDENLTCDGTFEHPVLVVECDNATTQVEIENSAKIVADGVVEVNKYISTLDNLTFWTEYEVENASDAIAQVDNFATAYNVILKQSLENTFSWQRGGGIFYTIDTVFNAAMKYGVVFNEIYEESKGRMKKLQEVDSTGMLSIIKQFQKYNMPLSKEQAEFLKNIDSEIDLLVEFLQDARRKATNIRRYTRNAEKKLRFFGQKLKIDKDGFHTMLRKCEPMNKTLGQNIKCQSNTIDEQLRILDKRQAEVVAKYDLEIDEKVKKTKSDNMKSVFKEIGISVAILVGSAGAGSLIGKGLTKFIKPLGKLSTSVGAKTALRVTAKKGLSKGIGRAFKGMVARSTNFFAKGVWTVSERAFMITRFVGKAAVYSGPYMAYITLKALHEMKKANIKVEGEAELKKIYDARLEIELSKENIETLKVHRKDITKLKKGLEIVVDRVESAIESVAAMNTVFGDAINDLSNMISTAKAGECEAEIGNFLKFKISNVKCHWDKAHGKINAFEVYVDTAQLSQEKLQQFKDILTGDKQLDDLMGLLGNSNNTAAKDEIRWLLSFEQFSQVIMFLDESDLALNSTNDIIVIDELEVCVPVISTNDTLAVNDRFTDEHIDRLRSLLSVTIITKESMNISTDENPITLKSDPDFKKSSSTNGTKINEITDTNLKKKKPFNAKSTGIARESRGDRAGPLEIALDRARSMAWDRSLMIARDGSVISSDQAGSHGMAP